MVFAARVVEAIEQGKESPAATGAMRAVAPAEASLAGPAPLFGSGRPADVDKLRGQLQRAMTSGAGVLRTADSLDSAAATLAEVASVFSGESSEVAVLELVNLVRAGLALIASARARTETRGAHTRTDFPSESPELRRRLVLA
jgi:L-aspartate oxidase